MIQQPQEVPRPTLFFGQWNLCARFRVSEASALRGVDHGHIDRVIQVRRQWADRYRNINPGGSWRSYGNSNITDDCVDTLHKICTMLQNEQRDHKLMISGDFVYVYTNDRDLLNDFSITAGTPIQDFKQAKLQGQPGAIALQSPVHAWRSFFRNRSLDSNTGTRLANFLQAQSDIRLGPALEKCIKNQWTRYQSWYFMDHDSPTTVTMLSMISPGIVRKTLPIVGTDK
jgi:hypothetical protein